MRREIFASLDAAYTIFQRPVAVGVAVSALPEMAHFYNFDRGISGPQCECQMCGDEIDEEDEGMCRRCEYGECTDCGGVLDEYGDCEDCGDGDDESGGYRRCCGTTQRGTHCQIDSNSVSSYNRTIAQAAQRLYDGHNYCGFHADQERYGQRSGSHHEAPVCDGCGDLFDWGELEEVDDELLCEECAGQVEVECDECGGEFPRDTMSDGVCEDCVELAIRQQAAAAQRQAALAAQQQRAVADAAHKSGEVQFSHVRTREERDAEGYANAIDLDADAPPAPKPAAAKPKAVAKKPAAKPAAATKKAAAKPAAAKPKKTIAKAKPLITVAVEPAAAEPRRSGRSRGAAPNKLDL